MAVQTKMKCEAIDGLAVTLSIGSAKLGLKVTEIELGQFEVGRSYQVSIKPLMMKGEVPAYQPEYVEKGAPFQKPDPKDPPKTK